MGKRILRPNPPRSGVSLSHLMATNQRKSRPHAPVQSCLCRHQVSGLLLFQSIHSSLENEAVVDLSGLHESVVDSDEDLADSLDVRLKKSYTCHHSVNLIPFHFQSMAIREPVRECLEKDPGP